MAQWKSVYVLQAHRPEFKSTASTQKPNLAMHACNPSPGERRQEDPCSSLLADASSDSVTDLVSKSKVVEEDI